MSAIICAVLLYLLIGTIIHGTTERYAELSNPMYRLTGVSTGNLVLQFWLWPLWLMIIIGLLAGETHGLVTDWASARWYRMWALCLVVGAAVSLLIVGIARADVPVRVRLVDVKLGTVIDCAAREPVAAVYATGPRVVTINADCDLLTKESFE